MSRLAFSAVFAAALTGCTGEASKDQAPPGDSGTTVTDDTGDGGTGEDLLQPGEGAFGGRIVDDDGAPLEGILVNLCKESCYAQRTDADGRWQHVVPADIYSFEALEGDPMAPTRGWPLAPVKVEDGAVRTLDTDVKMPLLTHQQELRTEEWVAIADGLDLFCDPNSWTPPDLAAEDAEPWVGGVRVDVASSGLPWDLLPGEPELRTRAAMPTAEAVAAWTEADWDAFTCGKAMRRAKLEQWQRNAKILLANRATK